MACLNAAALIVLFCAKALNEVAKKNKEVKNILFGLILFTLIEFILIFLNLFFKTEN
jgi:hypothetical protein